jgi:hypothetical protein
MKQLDKTLTKHFDKIFWGLSCVFLVLYLLFLGSGDNYIWTDEAYTFAMVRHSFAEIWSITGADVHPPFYYFYLKVLISPFNYNIFAAKIASIIPYMFIIIWGGMQVRKLFDEKTAILFMGMFFCFPYAFAYSMEIRMYSLAAAFVFACAVFAYRFWIGNGGLRDIMGLVVFGVLTAYTHYFAFASVCVIYGLLFIALLINKRELLWKWLLSVVASIILYLPWISSLFSQLVYKVNNDYWINEITVSTLYDYWRNLFGIGGYAVFAVLLSAAYIACLVWIIIKRDKRDFWLCLCCLLVPFGTIAGGVLVSIIVRPVFIIRYVVPSIPLLVMFMAIAMRGIDSDIIFKGVLGVVILCGMGNYAARFYFEYTNSNYFDISEYCNVDAYLVDSSGYTDRNRCDQIAGVLGYYVNDKDIYYDHITAADPYINWVSIDEFDSDTVNQAVLFSEVGEAPQSEYYDMYDVEYIGKWRLENYTDVYLLTKK